MSMVTVLSCWAIQAEKGRRFLGRPLALVATGLLLAAALACGSRSGGTQAAAPAPTPAPTIGYFSAPSYLLGGSSSAQLAWQVTGATSLTLDQGIGTVTGSTCWVHPNQTTTYTLTASNAGGSVSATCTLTVFPATAGATSLLASIPNAPVVDGPAAFARFSYTSAVVADPSGNLLIADYGNRAIRMLSAQGLVSTPLPSLPQGGPSYMTMGPSGNVYFFVGSSLCRFKPGGALTTLAGVPDQTGSADGVGASALFNYPKGLAVDAAENIYVADTGNHTIRLVTPQGQVSTLAGSPGMTGRIDGAGISARFVRPSGLVVDASGSLLVVDSGNWAVRSITPGGVVTTRAPWPTTLPLWNPNALALGPDGSLFVGGENAIARITPAGAVSIFAGVEGKLGWVDGPGATARFSTISGLTVDAAGQVLVADYQNSAIRAIKPDGEVTTLAGQRRPALFGPVNFGMDAAGNVFLPASNNTILKITPAGTVSTYAGVPNQSGALDGPASQALFGAAVSTAVDGSGNVFVTDALNATLRKITPAGQVTTVAGAAGQTGTQDGLGSQARFSAPAGLAADAQGNLYVTDGNAIRRMGPDGLVTTLAGMAGQAGSTDGIGASARFDHPYGLAVDPSGILFVADFGNAAIRRISPEGGVTTLRFTLGSAGSASVADVGKLLYAPSGIAVDRNGSLLVQDIGGWGPLQISSSGVACRVPVFNTPATLNFTGSGLAFRNGILYSASAWGVLRLNLN
ncbi:hypothetical protein GETHOR_10570 [Geothrix oryzae]|uniref:NHL repeat-containing protein n=1 Tax=Geothrix oryzae TaxID=2927975 RepID=A0ABN6UW51_9BACT|nr:hypothetical protein [Geothrix oryzae]BDU68956.1 hypothetical protein GETHOR_10570 [Geothrix oryzae]